VEAIFCEVQMILTLTAEKMYRSSAKVVPKLLNALISMVFSTIMKFENLKPVDADRRIGEVWQRIDESVSTNWIVTRFSPEFGNPDKHGSFQAVKEDIEVCKDLFLMCRATV
jgi:hypothetical protein